MGHGHGHGDDPSRATRSLDFPRNKVRLDSGVSKTSRLTLSDSLRMLRRVLCRVSRYEVSVPTVGDPGS